MTFQISFLKKNVTVLLDYISPNRRIALLQEKRRMETTAIYNNLQHHESEQGRNWAFYFHMIRLSESVLSVGFF